MPVVVGVAAGVLSLEIPAVAQELRGEGVAEAVTSEWRCSKALQLIPISWHQPLSDPHGPAALGDALSRAIQG